MAFGAAVKRGLLGAEELLAWLAATCPGLPGVDGHVRAFFRTLVDEGGSGNIEALLVRGDGPAGVESETQDVALYNLWRLGAGTHGDGRKDGGYLAELHFEGLWSRLVDLENSNTRRVCLGIYD